MSTNAITLPSMRTTFTIDVQGKETPKIYQGTFTYERLSLGKRLEVSKMEARLREDLLTLPTDISAFTEMVAFLRFGLIEFPDWWRESNYGLNLFDVNVITSIYLKTQEFEKEWEAKVYGKKEETKPFEEIKAVD